MIYQKFIPEGWDEKEVKDFDFETDKSKVFQGIVKRFVWELVKIKKTRVYKPCLLFCLFLI